MTAAQKRLREFRERQSKERQRMVELVTAESLTDETRAELDKIEAGTPDLERQLRAAQVAVDDEETEQRAANAAARQPEGDAEDRERAELRGKVRMSNCPACRSARGRVWMRCIRSFGDVLDAGRPAPLTNL